MNRFVWAVALSATPIPAYANAGIGYFLIALPFVVGALLPAILLEACVLAPLLPVPMQRALALSFRVNVRSTLWGLGLGIAVDIALMGASGSSGPEPTKAAATVMLVPLFLLTWLIEYRAMARLETDVSRARIALSTGAANLLSYAAMIAFVWMTSVLPEHGTMTIRARVTEAILAGSGARTVVQEYYSRTGRLPQSGAEAGFPRDSTSVSKLVSAVEIQAKGVVVVTLNKDTDWPDGGEITLTPAKDVATKTLISWKCDSTLPHKLLPGSCRG